MCRVALLQNKVTEDKKKNLDRAAKMIKEAAGQGAQLAVLPEMFNCPYDNKFFPLFAEDRETGETVRLLASLARELKIWIIGGSIPEREKDGIYNTSFIFDSKGDVIARHRKMHLYDVAITDGICFRESEILKPGNKITVFGSPWGKIGVMICYDVRFPEVARIMALSGARIIAVPAAFNLTSGPAHWEPQMRVRALDNQVFLLAVSPARNMQATYHAYGHSMIVSPWGEILAEAGHDEEMIVMDLPLYLVDRTREEFPLLKHRRTDIYEVITIKDRT